jgi:hypothetical protein
MQVSDDLASIWKKKSYTMKMEVTPLSEKSEQICYRKSCENTEDLFFHRH